MAANSPCACQKRFTFAIAEVEAKALRYPSLEAAYQQTALELRRIELGHFHSCGVCQQIKDIGHEGAA